MGGDFNVDMSKITDKEIQFNIMIALMQISGHLSDLVNQGETVDYMEVSDIDTSGLSK